MYYYLINHKSPMKSKYPIMDNQQAQGKVKNMIVTDVDNISIFSYLYYFVKYEIHG